MKIFHLFMWASFVVALLMLLSGFINFLMDGGFLGVIHSSSFFHLANSFFLLAIFSKLMEKKDKAD